MIAAIADIIGWLAIDNTPLFTRRRLRHPPFQPITTPNYDI